MVRVAPFLTHSVVAVNEGMRAVKLCSDKTLQFVTGGGDLTQIVLHNGCKLVVAVVVITFTVIYVHFPCEPAYPVSSWISSSTCASSALTLLVGQKEGHSACK